MSQRGEGFSRDRGLGRSRGRGQAYPAEHRHQTQSQYQSHGGQGQNSTQGQGLGSSRGWSTSGRGRGSSTTNSTPVTANSGSKRSPLVQATMSTKRQMELMPSVSRSSGLAVTANSGSKRSPLVQATMSTKRQMELMPSVSRSSGLAVTANSGSKRSPLVQATMSTKRQMELMPSVSRSSGLDEDGDSLKNHKVQEEYHAFIEEKLEKVLRRQDNLGSETEDEKKHRLEEQENVLILFRKLREGISSSNRIDSFSIKVYERSLYLSLIFTSPKHTTAIIPILLNDLYPKAFPSSPPATQQKSNPGHLTNHLHISLLLSLLHYLVSTYPSQSLYQQQRTPAPNNWLPQFTHIWLKSLTRSLRTTNYYQFAILTHPDRVIRLAKDTGIGVEGQASEEILNHDELAKRALLITVEALRAKARETIWSVMHSAYRELWFEEAYDTRLWFGRSLCLDDKRKSSSSSTDVDHWLDRVCAAGHIRKKEGTDTRWIVAKVR